MQGNMVDFPISFGTNSYHNAVEPNPNTAPYPAPQRRMGRQEPHDEA